MSDGGKLLHSWRRLLEAEHAATPWVDGVKIPWNDPELSRRFLAVHLDQDTHMASRSFEIIARHVAWLQDIAAVSFPGTRPLRVLDLTCGPGFYCHELARKGHDTFGIDYSPAAVAHAVATAEATGLTCRFREADVCAMDDALFDEIGTVDVATLWFGEINAFAPDDVRRVLAALARPLRPGGIAVIEYQPEDLFLKDDVQEWQAVEETVFRDGPQLWLQSYRWDEATRSEINDHWILDAATGHLERFTQCHRAWTDQEMVELLHEAGLIAPAFHPPITGCDERLEFPVIVATRAP